MIKQMMLAAGLCLALWCTVEAAAVTGTVTDSDTQKPIGSVLVRVKGTSLQAYTNAQGTFSIAQAPSGINYLLPGAGPAQKTLSLEGQVLYSITGTRTDSRTALIPDGMYLVRLNRSPGGWVKVIKAGTILNIQQKNGTANTTACRHKSAAAQITIEAETMTLNNYIPDTDSRLTGQTIMVDPKLGVPATGTAATFFTRVSGTYKITLTVVPENDGTPTVKLYTGGNKILEETIPSDASYHTLAKRKEYVVTGVALKTGDEIKIEGTSNGAAFARIDRIVISDGNDIILVLSHNDYVEKEVAARFGEAVNVSLAPRPKAGEKPGPHNTGYTGTLKPFSGTITAGAVIENAVFSGGITISVSNVTIRNFKINGNGAQYGIKIDGGTGHVFEDGEISDCISCGVMGSNVTLRRLNIHDTQGDGLKMHNNALIEGCWIHRIGKGDGAHADGNQTRSGSNLTFRGNNFDMPSPGTPNYPGAPYKSNACIFLSTAAGPISNVLIENNWLNGGGYTIYSIDKGRGYGTPKNVRVINNRFGRDNGGYPDKISSRIRNGTFAEWTGNVWEDTGQPCP